jgi:hypothetical protein
MPEYCPEVVLATPLPDSIEVVEGPGSEVLYRLSRRPLGRWRLLGLVPIAFGAMMASWPILAVFFFLSHANPAGAEARLFLIFGPLVCFGPVCFPFAAALIVFGLFVIAGHNEVAIRSGQLWAIHRCGPLHWTRRKPLEQLRGFRVEHFQNMPHPRSGPSALPLAWPVGWESTARLVADGIDGKTFAVCQAYPRALLLGLADELARRIPQEAVTNAGASVAPLEVGEVSLDPTEIQERPEQPANSPAIRTANAGGLTITLPPAGMRRGNGRAFLLWTLCWNGFLIPFTAFMVPAAFMGQVKWEGGNQPVNPWFCVLFLTPFWAVGFGSLFGLLHQARRRAVLAVIGDRLEIHLLSPLGNRRYEWGRDELAGIRVESTFVSDGDGGGHWKTDLCTQPHSGQPVHLLDHRKKPELEWIATELRQALQVPAGQPKGNTTPPP